jgi:hypothetical protein
MNKQNIFFSVFVAVSALFGVAVTGMGIYLFVNGQDCLSYNDYACAFSAMFSFIVIPYGLAIFLFIGLASLPFRITRLIGAVLSTLTGFANVGLCCVTTMWAFSSDGANLLNQDMGMFLLFPFAMFLGGLALLGVGVTGYMRAKQA